MKPKCILYNAYIKWHYLFVALRVAADPCPDMSDIECVLVIKAKVCRSNAYF
jgi:hypothetical protein